tara:strand:- start:42251 stop:42427 length:177 start_codon:yes stop_codon:yes gene_type:complete
LGHLVGPLLAFGSNCFIVVSTHLADIFAFSFAGVWGNPHPFHVIGLVHVAIFPDAGLI